jgi:recombination endonuclease VII
MNENITPTKKTRGPKKKTHCKRGHLLEGDNVKQLFNPNGTKAGRKCMECNRILHRKWYHADSELRCSKVRQYRKDNPDAVKNARLKRDFGITLDQYKKILETQEGQCALCGSTEPGRKDRFFAVDHCHITGKVRALLCLTCNVALGAAKDNPALLRKMADYIESYQ